MHGRVEPAAGRAALRALMRHKSYQKTQKYINTARQMDTAVASLHVPKVLRMAGN
jgi:hypothetical protein